MEEIKIKELKCNLYQLIIDELLMPVEASYSYKFYDISHGEPEYAEHILLSEGGDTVVELESSKNAVFLLEVKRDVSGSIETTSAMFISMCKLESLKSYALKMILCGDDDCNPRHDCDNCDSLRDLWNIRLSELNMMYYELIGFVRRYAETVEDLFDDDKNTIKLRIADIVNKISITIDECVSATDCQCRKKIRSKN